MTDYPQLIADSEITVPRAGNPESAPVRAWLVGWDGPRPTYRIELTVADDLTGADQSRPNQRSCAESG